MESCASRYTFVVTKTAIAKGDFEVVEHPPYLLDLAPSDYRLLLKLNEHLPKKRCPSDCYEINEVC